MYKLGYKKKNKTKQQNPAYLLLVFRDKCGILLKRKVNLQGCK